MANDHIALGVSALVLIQYPDELPSDAALKQTLLAVDRLGNYKDGLVLAQLDPSIIPKLRRAGAQVFVIDGDSNQYIANTEGMGEDERVKYIDERLQRAKDDQQLVASAGGGGKGVA